MLAGSCRWTDIDVFAFCLRAAKWLSVRGMLKTNRPILPICFQEVAVCQWVECPGFCVVAVLLLVWLWRMVIECAAAKLLCDR